MTRDELLAELRRERYGDMRALAMERHAPHPVPHHNPTHPPYEEMAADLRDGLPIPARYAPPGYCTNSCPEGHEMTATPAGPVCLACRRASERVRARRRIAQHLAGRNG